MIRYYPDTLQSVYNYDYKILPNYEKKTEKQSRKEKNDENRQK